MYICIYMYMYVHIEKEKESTGPLPFTPNFVFVYRCARSWRATKRSAWPSSRRA